jgi:CubicO group peptidase (beta-lactamase class C family)
MFFNVFRVVLLTSVTLLATPLTGQERPSEEDFAKLVSAYQETFGFSGTVKVVANEQTLFEKSYGLANRSFGIANTPSTRMSINSISKTFTALAVMQLVEAGNIDLHVPIANYLPYLDAPWENTVTVHHLLTHSSGLPRESGVQAHDDLSLRAQVVQLVAAQELAFSPGEQYSYSNSGIILLGAIIEQVTGQEYVDVITAKIIQPLQLADTGVYQGRGVVARQAEPYRLTRSGVEAAQRSKHWGENAGGGLYSTPSDLYRFVLALEHHELLSQELTELMFTPHLKSGETDAEGYAWSLKKFGDADMHFAAGSGYGTKSVMVRLPASKDFIAITSNWGNTPVLNMLGDIFMLLQGQQVTPPDSNQLAKSVNFASNIGSYQFDPQQLQQQLMMAESVIKLHAFEGKLFLNDELLTSKGEGVLGLTYTDELRITFDGAQMVIEINGNRLVGDKL